MCMCVAGRLRMLAAVENGRPGGGRELEKDRAATPHPQCGPEGENASERLRLAW